jgi:hypothetical protein
MASHDEPAGVIAPPPLLFVAAWATAAALHRRAPLEIARGGARSARVAGGAAYRQYAATVPGWL